MGGDPKVKIDVVRTDIFCTKSAALKNFLNGHHVESLLKYSLSSLKCFKQKNLIESRWTSGVMTLSKLLDPIVEISKF